MQKKECANPIEQLDKSGWERAIEEVEKSGDITTHLVSCEIDKEPLESKLRVPVPLISKLNKF